MLCRAVTLALVLALGATTAAQATITVRRIAYDTLLVTGTAGDNRVAVASDATSVVLRSTTDVFQTSGQSCTGSGTAEARCARDESLKVVELELAAGDDVSDTTGNAASMRVLHPGAPGADQVLGGPGPDDLVTSLQDGPDLLDGGPGGGDQLIVSGAAVAALVTPDRGADDGAAGEGDDVRQVDVIDVFTAASGNRIDLTHIAPARVGVIVHGGTGTVTGSAKGDLANVLGGTWLVAGGDGDDFLAAGSAPDSILSGQGGNDTVHTFRQSAQARGGPGDDFFDIYGNPGAIDGGSGDDTLSLRVVPEGADHLVLEDGAVTRVAYHDAAVALPGGTLEAVEAVTLPSGIPVHATLRAEGISRLATAKSGAVSDVVAALGGTHEIDVGAGQDRVDVRNGQEDRLSCADDGDVIREDAQDDVACALPPPAATTLPATAVGRRSALLHGSAATADGPAASARFVVDGVARPSVALGEGHPAQPVEQPLDGLEPGRTYEVRLEVRTSRGTALGAPVAFTTAPAIPVAVTGAVGPVVEGTVDPEGESARWFVEWGTGEVPDRTTPEIQLPAGDEPVAVHAELGGLAPGTTYRARVVAVGPFGTSRGELKAFRTADAPPPVFDPPPTTGSSGPCSNGADDDGDGFVDGRDPQCAAGRGTEFPRDNAILACAGRRLVLTDVLPTAGGRVRLAGLADPTLAGRAVDLYAGGTRVGRTRVATDGSYATTVRGGRPARTRYEARLGSLRSGALVLDRRTIDARLRTLTVTGRVTASDRGRAVVELQARSSCGSYRTIVRGRLRADGTFAVRVPAGLPAGTVIRARIRLPGRRTTYTLPRAT